MWKPTLQINDMNLKKEEEKNKTQCESTTSFKLGQKVYLLCNQIPCIWIYKIESV